MDNFKEAVYSIFEIEENDEIKFKTIEISPDKTIYFAVRESEKRMFGELTSLTLTPDAFILKVNGEYHYCPLNDKDSDEDIVKEFLKECL